MVEGCPCEEKEMKKTEGIVYTLCFLLLLVAVFNYGRSAGVEECIAIIEQYAEDIHNGE